MAKKKYPNPLKDDGSKEETRTAKDKSPMTETELLAIVDTAVRNSLGKFDSKLSSERLQAMKYYLGDKTGNLAPPEAEGRSSVVSTDLSDTIEWILPALIRIFVSGENAVEYAAKKEADIDGAQQSTDWANHVLFVQNDGFIIFHDWFKDALLQKLGTVKTWWDDSKDITTEEYENQTLDEITLMLQDGTVEVIQQTSHELPVPEGLLLAYQQAIKQIPRGQQAPPPPQPEKVYDIKVKRTADSSYICIENVPPEEFLFSRKARSIKRMFDCHHKIQRTVTELREAGYKNVDELMTEDGGAEFSQEAVERDSETNEFSYGGSQESSDESMRFVWITESYMQVDWNNDGLAEWRKIVKSGKILLENEEIDEHPFSVLTPIKMPHKLVGRSIADLLMDLQDIKTALWRQFIDNMYLRNNPRTYVDTTKSVNIDDLLDSRVGGIVRGKGENGIQPIITQDLSPQSFSLLSYIDQVKADRTGVNDTSKGLDADTLTDSTNNNRNQLVSAAQAKLELIARIFAETGVKDLFRKILKLSGQYQKKPQVMRLTGNKFVTVDPRAWKTQYDVTINVGLGNGNKDQMAGHIMNIMNIQKEAMLNGLPITGAKQMYNSAKKLVVNSGFKSADPFFVDPHSPEGQQLAQQAASKPNPGMMKLQAQQQLNEQQMQLKQQDAAAQNAIQKANDDRDYQRQQAKDQNDYQLELAKIEAQKQAKLQEMEYHGQLELQKHAMSLDAQSKPTTSISLDSNGVLDGIGSALIDSANHIHNIANNSQQTHGAILETLHNIANSHAAQAGQKTVRVKREADGSLTGIVG